VRELRAVLVEFQQEVLQRGFSPGAWECSLSSWPGKYADFHSNLKEFIPDSDWRSFYFNWLIFVWIQVNRRGGGARGGRGGSPRRPFAGPGRGGGLLRI